MAYYTDQEYTITNVAYVYDPNVVDNSDNRESLISRGTIKSGNVIFTAFKTIDSAYVSADSGATLGLVSSNCKLTFSAKPNGNPMPLAGMYLSTRTLQLVNNGSSVDDATGLTNVNTVTGNLRFCVASNKTLPVYNYPSDQGTVVHTRSAGSQVRVFATYKGSDGQIYGRITADSLNDTGNDLWILLYYDTGRLNTALTEDGITTANNATDGYNFYYTEHVDLGTENRLTNGSAVMTEDGRVTDAEEFTYADPYTFTNEIRNTAANMSISDADALEALQKMESVIGLPPQVTDTADIQYMATAETYPNSFGRCYTETFMQQNCIFSIQPGKVKYMPGFSDKDKQSFWNLASDLLRNNTLSEDQEDVKNNLTGQLFEFTSNYNEYINTVNLLARVMSIYLGIGERTYPDTRFKYKNMDYSFYKMPQKSTNKSNTNIFGGIVEGVRAVTDALFTSAINDDTYIHFYMSADGTSVDEDLTVLTRQSSLETLFNGTLSELSRDIEFLKGFAATGDALTNAITEITGSVGDATAGTLLGNMATYGANYLKGGRLVFPSMLDDVTFGRSYQGTCRFISASGDPEAIFLNCFLPTCYLFPFVIPQMLSENMYTYPCLAKVHSKGLFSCDLAAITNLRIQRGGSNADNWSTDGLPTEIDVSFTITPLYSKLMTTTYKHPILFLQNTALQEYLGAMCGISFVGNQMKLKGNIIMTLLTDRVTNVIPSLLRGYYDSSVANFMRRIYNIP